MTEKQFHCEDDCCGCYTEINLGVKELVELLKYLREENDELKKQITSLKIELNIHKHPLWSTKEAERKISELTDLLSDEIKKNAILLQEINSLRKENMRLKEVRKYEYSS